MTPTDFAVGDRVTYTGMFTRELSGKLGTVIRIKSNQVMVMFDDLSLDRVYTKPEGFGCLAHHLTKMRPVFNSNGRGWDWVSEGLSKHGAAVDKAVSSDVVSMPQHYRNHPSGVECITITQHMNFCRGNAIKYVWRAGEKGGKDKEIEDLRKARQYLDIEIKRLETAK